MPELQLFQVDAFADALFCGNPAAVCPLNEWLPDAIMQAIAAENNLSETAFFVQDNVSEDPVTGSAHCVIAPYWCRRLGLPMLSARQGGARQGRLDCEVQDNRVLLYGDCQLYLEGKIYV